MKFLLAVLLLCYIVNADVIPSYKSTGKWTREVMKAPRPLRQCDLDKPCKNANAVCEDYKCILDEDDTRKTTKKTARETQDTHGEKQTTQEKKNTLQRCKPKICKQQRPARG